LLSRGGTVIEATSGNTGLGLALVAIQRGYQVILVLPDKMSPEKINLVKAIGCKVIVCPTDVEADDPRSYYSVKKIRKLVR
jgi:cystathionine beta-synthase